MTESLKNAIEKLDISAVQECLKGEPDLTNLTLSLIIEQYGEADEDMLWEAASKEGDLNILRREDSGGLITYVLSRTSTTTPDNISTIDKFHSAAVSA